MASPVEGMKTASASDRFDIGAVENALAELWVSKDPTGRDADTVRACAVNFVLPIKPGSYTQWQSQVAELSCLVPSRILIIESAPSSATPPIHAYVNAACHRRKDGFLVCSEVVHIATVPDASTRIPSICRALAVSDLPLVYLALDKGALNPQALQALIEPADLIIVDSHRREEDIGSDELVFCDGDLAWPRLVPWRSAVGHFLTSYDHFPCDAVHSVHVIGEAASGPLLAGWISYLLGWRRPKNTGSPSGIKTASGAPVTFSFERAGAGVGGITSVALRLTTGERDRVTFTSVGNQECKIEARVGDTHVSTQQSIKQLTFAEEVAHIVHCLGADKNYVQARRFAHGLSGQ